MLLLVFLTVTRKEFIKEVYTFLGFDMSDTKQGPYIYQKYHLVID